MMMKRTITCLLVLLFLLNSGSVFADADIVSEETRLPFSQTPEQGSYGWYLQNDAYEDATGETIPLFGTDAVPETVISGDKKEQDTLLWSFEAPADGRYLLKARYRPDNGTEEIERGIKVNGVAPYKEIESFILTREYQNDGEPLLDTGGNEIRPEQVAVGRMTENYLYDYVGSYAEALSVNIEQGTNTLRLTALSGEAVLEAILLVPAALPNYTEAKETYASAGLTVYKGENITLEAEDAVVKSDSTLYPVSDKSSPLVSPLETGKILLNTIGGYRWETVGQYIEWKMTVPDEGLYTLSFKVRQNVTSGQQSSRILTVNGEIPFSEMKTVTVPFSAKWQMLTLGNGTESYLFHLKKGDNVIRLQATLGQMDAVVRQLDSSVRVLNEIYRELLMIIGASPDKSRDYKLDELVPGQISKMASQAELLGQCADWMEAYNGGSNAGIGLIRTMVRQLREISSDSDKIAKEFSYFKTNIGALGTWLSAAKQQPLELDYIVAGNEQPVLPDVNAGFFSQMMFDAKEFLWSFITDYKNIGEQETAGEQNDGRLLRVWIASGRDQAQIIRSMISDSFTPVQGIKVKLELVQAGTLLPATVAGIGPDVNIGGADVINFAMRNAACDLTQFENFEEIRTSFNDALFVPLRYMKGIYGVPESVSFPVLFYRQDILEELGLAVPETWDDVVAMSSVLAKNNMEFGLPAGSSTYLLLLRQHGLDNYSNGGAFCALDSVAAINVFQEYTNYYVNYGLPLSYDLVNRFRSGEMPIAIADFNVFNNLQVAAPEINGLWDFSLIPGTQREDGTVDRTTLAGTSASMILENSKNQDLGWKFLCWWTSADIQERYGREIESLLGSSARYSSANLEAFDRSSWSKANLAVLKKQMQSLTAVEQVPGGYFLTRHLDNAFRNVVYNGKKPMDMMFDYVYKINRELADKRAEFGLTDSTSGQE